MKTSELQKLVAIYGEQKAKQAAAWFTETTTAAFAACLKSAAVYCQRNEYLWF